MQIGIDGGVDAEPFIHRAIPSRRLNHLLPDVIDRVGLSLRVLSITDDDIVRLCLGAVLAIDESKIAHAGKCNIARFPRCCPIGPRRQPIWAFDDAGERRAFYQRHLACRFIEITAGGCLRPIESAPEINSVQIQLHDFLFVVSLLDAFREVDFEKFPTISLFLERKTVARELLGDRACTLSHVAGDKIFEGGPHDAGRIVAAMLIKFVVFHRDNGVYQIARQLIVGNGLAVLDVDLAEDFSVPIEDHAGRFHLFELAQIVSGRFAF